jgi:hypothetical protein
MEHHPVVSAIPVGYDVNSNSLLTLRCLQPQLDRLADRFYPRRRAIGESKVVYRRNQRLGMGVITCSELCPDCHHGDQRSNQTILQDDGGPLVERQQLHHEFHGKPP